MGAPSVPEAMTAEEMLDMQRATAEAQLELEDQRLEHMLDVEQQRIDMEAAEKDRLKQQGVAEEAALQALEQDLNAEVEAQDDASMEDEDLLSGFGSSLLSGLQSQGQRPS